MWRSPPTPPPTPAGAAAEQSDDQSGGRRARARRGQGDLLRDEIVDTASRLLAESGEIAELSLRAVARAVGVATTSIYLHFANLDELVLAVKKGYLADFGAALTGAAEHAGSEPRDRVRARAHEYVRYGLAHRGRYQVMFSSELLPARVMPAGRYLGAEIFAAVREEIAAVVGSGVDPDLLGVHFWTALHGTVTLRTVRRNFPWPDLDRQLDDLIDRILGL